MSLTPDQTRRYARQLFLDEVGADGQRRLLDATVAVEGDGAAAEEAATYLAAAGVGRLVLGPAAAARLTERLEHLNPDVRVIQGYGEASAAITSITPDTRLGGSLAALTVLVGLSGAGAPPAFAAADVSITW